MNKVRDDILRSIGFYKEFWKHKDLAAFCVCSESFTCEDEGKPDFDELTVVVEKDWLYNFMKEHGIENPLDYLQNEYTTDDSIIWFNEAGKENKVVMVDFD